MTLNDLECDLANYSTTRTTHGLSATAEVLFLWRRNISSGGCYNCTRNLHWTRGHRCLIDKPIVTICNAVILCPHKLTTTVLGYRKCVIITFINKDPTHINDRKIRHKCRVHKNVKNTQKITTYQNNVHDVWCCSPAASDQQSHPWLARIAHYWPFVTTYTLAIQ